MPPRAPESDDPSLSPPIADLADLADTEVAPGASSVRVVPGELGTSEPDRSFASRYVLDSLLGEGGMGEVRSCKDMRIGRAVAMKVIRAEKNQYASIRARFLREARVQGQLEHPSIVPVYDLDVGPDGAVYFTMKRVLGMTLGEIIRGLRENAPGIVREYSRRRLLTAFSSVCLAIDFAHARGVIHRDLKPENVMLGSFGEVYVLDWGIAKVTGETEDEALLGSIEQATALKTAVGSFVGTLGYMSPEQLCGAAVDARSDVYALGAILFELLALEALHTGAAPQVSASTVGGVDARVSQRAPKSEVAPELELLCVKATALDPADRFATARDLQQALERYLDGDRDLAQRRSLGAAHAEAATKLLGDTPGDLPSRERALAMRELGRAVVLDPANELALTTMASLLLEPPREVPAEVRQAVERSNATTIRGAAHSGALAYSAWLLLLPVVVMMGPHDWRWTATTTFFYMLTLLALAWVSRTGTPSRTKSFAILATSTLALMSISRMFGSLVLVPSVAIGTVAGYAIHPDRIVRRAAMLLMMTAIFVPLALEIAGVLPASYAFAQGQMVILPHMTELPQVPSLLFLAAASALMLLGINRYVEKVNDALKAAEQKLFLQAWHLGQLVPDPTRRGGV